MSQTNTEYDLTRVANTKYSFNNFWHLHRKEKKKKTLIIIHMISVCQIVFYIKYMIFYLTKIQKNWQSEIILILKKKTKKKMKTKKKAWILLKYLWRNESAYEKNEIWKVLRENRNLIWYWTRIQSIIQIY